jgi:citrate lyase beta subunit
MPEPPGYLGIRSIMETPLLDDRKWAKIPGIPADAILIDLEDSLPPSRKDEGRARAVEVLAQPEFFAGRITISRPNDLSSPWGRDDIQALAEAGAPCVALPKLRSADDLLQAQEVFRSAGADPDIFAIVETAQAVLEVAKIAAAEKVVAIMFGAGDLSVDSSIPLLDPDGGLNPAMIMPKVQTVLAGSAFGRLTTDTAFMPDIRDLADARRRYAQSRQIGFTAAVTFYPPHVEIINETFGPAPADVEEADLVIGEYEAALVAGNPAVQLAGGRVLLVHDYDKALKVRRRADAVASAAAGVKP